MAIWVRLLAFSGSAAVACFYWEWLLALLVIGAVPAALQIVLGAMGGLLSTPGRAASLLAGVLLGYWLGGNEE